MAVADHEETVFLRECRSEIRSKTDIVRERLFERVRMPRGDDSICTLFRFDMFVCSHSSICIFFLL